MAGVHQTLCDVCELPTEAGPGTVRLGNGYADLYTTIGGLSYSDHGYISLHMHAHCWDAIRWQFLSERRRDEEATSRRAKERERRKHEIKQKPWLVRLVLDLLESIGRL